MKKVVWVAVSFALLAAAAFVYRIYMVGELRKPVLAKLNDPASAQFRNERTIGWTPYNAILCGEVNAKNRMGGYTGFAAFFAAAKVEADIVGVDGAFAGLIEAQCSVIDDK